MASGGSLGWEQVGNPLYAPIIKNAVGGRSSHMFVVNAGQTATYANIQFYNANTGSPVGALGSYYLVPFASVVISSSECPTGVLCSAKITSSNGQLLAAVIREQTDGSTYNRTTHNAFSSGATNNFAPLIKKNAGGQTTNLAVRNLGTNSTTVTIVCYDRLTSTTYDCDGPGSGVSINGNATAVFMIGSPVPDGFIGSAVVSSSGQPIATLIYETGNPYKLVTNAPSIGSTTAYAPELYGNYVQNGQTWDTGISVQNLDSVNSATITVSYYRQNGTFVTSWSNTIGPYKTWILNYASGNLPGNFSGSAVITSNRPIAALVNVAHTGGGDTKANYTVPNR